MSKVHPLSAEELVLIAPATEGSLAIIEGKFVGSESMLCWVLFNLRNCTNVDQPTATSEAMRVAVAVYDLLNGLIDRTQGDQRAEFERLKYQFVILGMHWQVSQALVKTGFKLPIREAVEAITVG